MVGLYENRQAVGFATDPQLHSNRTVIHYKREYLVQLYYTRGSPQANPFRPPRGKKSSYTRTDLHLTLPPGGQTRSSLAGGSQPIALPCRSKAAATDQEAK